MIDAPLAAIDPFAVTVRGAAEPNPVHAALRAAGPIVRTDAPAGGSVWFITDEELARQVLADPRIVKDPAFAPVAWDPREVGLEATAAERPSLTTFDGPAHARLRRAHVPLFTARRMRSYTDSITTIARDLLTALAAEGGTVDLMADFTTRYPLTVLFDLLGMPLDRIDDATAACRAILGDDAALRGRAIGTLVELASTALRDGRDGLAAELREQLSDEFTDGELLYLLGMPLDRIDGATAACRAILGDDAALRGRAIGTLVELASTALRDGRDGLAAELREQLSDEFTDGELLYLLFGLIFAGQLTTDAALGFVLGYAIEGLDRSADGNAVDRFVQDMLRRYPPAPFTLWRFTSTEVELAGVRLPARSPVLVDIAGINTDPARASGPDLTFGAGPHYCIGAQLAALELRVAVQVLLTDFPDARLAVPFDQLRQDHAGGIQQGGRLVALPVQLRG